VIEGLNTIPLGDGNLKVMRATVGVKQQIGIDGGVGAISMLAGSHAHESQERSRVLCLLNMVTPDELINDDDYEGKQ
jgi:splicing factor U2AF subunit